VADGWRTEADEIGGVTLRVVRNWVLWFKAQARGAVV